MTGQPGTIVELDLQDSLGWIALDADGARVRFGGSALAEFHALPTVGVRVVVHGTTAGYKGVIKAVRVVPLDPPPPPPPPTLAPALAPLSWAAFVAGHPRWSAAESACLPFGEALPPLPLTPHPLWSAWAAELARSPVVVGLEIGRQGAPRPIEPTAADSFAHGRVAFLETATWPTCARCGAPLEHCLQLAPEVIAPWALGERAAGRGLVAMVCFPCAYGDTTDPRVAHVAFTLPRVRVETSALPRDHAYRPSAQRVTPRAPCRVPPSSAWLRDRAHRADGAGADEAAAALFGPPTFALVAPFPSGLSADDSDALSDDGGAELYDAWTALHVGAVWGGGALGGVPGWTQHDRTPRCPVDATHGEMPLLLSYDGDGQFLDGALHVFVCRQRGCDHLSAVAEF